MRRQRDTIKRPLAEVLADLPEYCFTVHHITNMPVMIQKGEEGYKPVDIDKMPKNDQLASRYMVNKLNRGLGVTRAQEHAMVVGSMFGWDVPGADPLNAPAAYQAMDERDPEEPLQ